MVCYFQLNGENLTDVGVVVKALPGHKVSRRYRQDTTDSLDSESVTQRVGSDLAELSIEFFFSGAGDTKYAKMREVWETLRDNRTFTLQAPEDKVLYSNYSRLALSGAQITQTDSHGKYVARISLQAIVLGAWVADGGDYCYDHFGQMTRNSDNTYTFDGSNIGAVPAIELPDQTTGYPKAINTGFVEAQLTFISSRSIAGNDGTNVTADSYDLTGYLVPAPALGETALFKVCSSPTSDFLDHMDGDYILGGVGTVTIVAGGNGIASAAIASGVIGS